MSEASDQLAVLEDEHTFRDHEVMLEVLGPRGELLAAMQRELGITMGQRGDKIRVRGAPERVSAALRLIDQLARTCRGGRRLREADVVRGARILADDPQAELDRIFNDVVHVTASRRLVTPKGLAQKRYVDALRGCDITFAIGPAGTGKTYLAVAMAVSEMLGGRFRRIVLTRPAVEAGERLGFLPGDLVEKVNPYLRPLYDALNDMLGPDRTQTLIAQGQIEIAPLAFMRGRTLNDSYVILDEAQNTTIDQMKMFLTRLGYSSKAVVTGDISQTDLPDGEVSGLVDAARLLDEIEGIAFRRFTEKDVVRHPLVQEIIRAYGRRDARRNGATADEPEDEDDGGRDS
ncbi:MAG: PhoH family protein [Polyangia bacterium]